LDKLERFLDKETPGRFLERARENPKQVSIEIKTRLGPLGGTTRAHITRYALKHFLEFYETDVRVNGRFRVRRVRRKEALSWNQAEQIIAECDEPYRNLFHFMLWAGIGEDEIMEIQTSPAILKSVRAQAKNDKPYVKFDLEPRKATLDGFFTLVLKKHVPSFPVLTRKFSGRGGVPVEPHDMQARWRIAAKKAGIWHEGLGPHHLRSVFKTTCDGAGVSPAVSEFCMGHGADRYGYSRPTEEIVTQELEKLWNRMKPATSQELEKLKEELGKRDTQIEKLSKLVMEGQRSSPLFDEFRKLAMEDPEVRTKIRARMTKRRGERPKA
jgi:integrase